MQLILLAVLQICSWPGGGVNAGLVEKKVACPGGDCDNSYSFNNDDVLIRKQRYSWGGDETPGGGDDSDGVQIETLEWEHGVDGAHFHGQAEIYKSLLTQTDPEEEHTMQKPPLAGDDVLADLNVSVEDLDKFKARSTSTTDDKATSQNDGTEKADNYAKSNVGEAEIAEEIQENNAAPVTEKAEFLGVNNDVDKTTDDDKKTESSSGTTVDEDNRSVDEEKSLKFEEFEDEGVDKKRKKRNAGKRDHDDFSGLHFHRMSSLYQHVMLNEDVEEEEEVKGSGVISQGDGEEVKGSEVTGQGAGEGEEVKGSEDTGQNNVEGQDGVSEESKIGDEKEMTDGNNKNEINETDEHECSDENCPVCHHGKQGKCTDENCSLCRHGKEEKLEGKTKEDDIIEEAEDEAKTDGETLKEETDEESSQNKEAASKRKRRNTGKRDHDDFSGLHFHRMSSLYQTLMLNGDLEDDKEVKGPEVTGQTDGEGQDVDDENRNKQETDEHKCTDENCSSDHHGKQDLEEVVGPCNVEGQGDDTEGEIGDKKDKDENNNKQGQEETIEHPCTDENCPNHQNEKRENFEDDSEEGAGSSEQKHLDDTDQRQNEGVSLESNEELNQPKEELEAEAVDEDSPINVKEYISRMLVKYHDERLVHAHVDDP